MRLPGYLKAVRVRIDGNTMLVEVRVRRRRPGFWWAKLKAALKGR